MKVSLIVFLVFLATSSWASPAKLCRYQTWEWDTIQKRSVNHHQVVKSYSDLTPEEKGKTSGCTICEEDQLEVKLPNIPTFKICKIYRDQIQDIILKAQAEGFPFQSIIAYRVGKSLGPTDAQGRRTVFSNHSYGEAIDFNSEINGMYGHCRRFNKNCRLMHGGSYKPQELGALTQQSPLYKKMKELGFHWGGEFAGSVKDFMHFSREPL